MKRIDAHQHFWQYQAERDAWMTDDMQVIRRDFMPTDLAPLLEAHRIDACVAVQADQSDAETRFLLELAEEHDFIAGVVGWIDLLSDGLESQLEQLQEVKKLVGFRHILQAEPKGFMTAPKFVKGVKLLAKYGFTYDILIYHYQLGDAVELIRQLPEMPLIIDHIAKPDIRAGEMGNWLLGTKRLAAFPHVCVKLSGMITEADWQHWTIEQIKPYVDATLKMFGTDRILFGSDWPVCLLAGGYAQAIGLMEACIASLHGIAQAKIMGENAIDFYKLDIDDW